MAAPFGNKNHTKHGLSHTRIDNIYKSMISRCYHQQNSRFDRYGGRGIVVCKEWLNDKNSFFEWSFNNGYAENLTIDRINPNGNYCPENCRWATYKMQANNRTNNRKIEINGVFHTIAEWSDISGVKIATIHARLKHGWDAKDAVFVKPILGNNQYIFSKAVV